MRARLLLLLLAGAAFGASLGSGFHFDDYAIFSDPVLNSSSGWLDIWSLARTRPLTYLTYWLNLQTTGRNAAAFHAFNLLLHAAAVLLLYECLQRLLDGKVALIAAAIFAVHPLQSEAVIYVWGRSIVLATVLCLAALLAWIAGRSWTAVACFAAALLAKEECAAFPLLLWLLDRKRVAPIAAMLGLSVAAGLRVIYATAVTPGAPAGVQAGISPAAYLLAQGPVVWRYLRLFVLPFGFSVDPDVRIPPLWLGLGAWAALAILLALMWRLRRPWFGWLAGGLLLLAPSSSIFPAADLAADRRMYLPMIGLTAAAGMLLAAVGRRAVAAAAVAALTALSIGRTQVWMTEESLWREAIRRAPEKVRPKIQLARNVPPAEAETVLAEARALAPQDPAIAAETGKLLLAEGRPAKALTEFGRALALNPRDASNLNNRGVALAALGQTEAARQDFTRALALDPSLSIARENLRKLPVQ
jgi:tetratricopeptide (TPR) repeat protein